MIRSMKLASHIQIHSQILKFLSLPMRPHPQYPKGSSVEYEREQGY